MRKLFTILTFSFLSLFAVKAQDDYPNCGILINGVLVDSIVHWNFKAMELVFPVKEEWNKYDAIHIGIRTYYDDKDNWDKRFFFLEFRDKQFSDNFSKGELGIIRMPYMSDFQLYYGDKGYYFRDIWCDDNYLFCSGWGKFEKFNKKDGNEKIIRLVVEVAGYTISGYQKIYTNQGTVEVPIYGNETTLYRSKKIPTVNYGTWKSKLVDKTQEVYFSGTGSNAGKPIDLKKVAVNYSEYYFIVKGGTNSNSSSSTTTPEVKTTTTKTETNISTEKVNTTSSVSSTALKPLDKKKPGYFAEKDGDQITREGYKKGDNLDGEVRDYTEGKIREVTTYVNGEKNGLSTSYFDNGKIEMTGAYKNDEKQGEWKFYDETGKLLETKKYLNGEVQD